MDVQGAGASLTKCYYSSTCKISTNVSIFNIIDSWNVKEKPAGGYVYVCVFSFTDFPGKTNVFS